jgi:hypothetical protein
MRKLRLEIESLEVESFRTSNETGWQGTVNARSGLEIADAGHVIEASVEFSCTITTLPASAEFSCTITAPPPKTLPPAVSCDTCYISCITACSCRTMPCDTCA